MYKYVYTYIYIYVYSIHIYIYGSPNGTKLSGENDRNSAVKHRSVHTVSICVLEPWILTLSWKKMEELPPCFDGSITIICHKLLPWSTMNMYVYIYIFICIMCIHILWSFYHRWIVAIGLYIIYIYIYTMLSGHPHIFTYIFYVIIVYIICYPGHPHMFTYMYIYIYYLIGSPTHTHIYIYIL